ncbi:MAG: hypothetical protein ABH867_01955 [Patescibacteria group bacterium]|nr:hypothetical protein [Patescibacteria group bacterium]
MAFKGLTKVHAQHNLHVGSIVEGGGKALSSSPTDKPGGMIPEGMSANEWEDEQTKIADELAAERQKREAEIGSGGTGQGENKD